MAEIYQGQLSPVLCDTMVAVYERPLRRTPGRRGIRVAVPSYPSAVTIRDPELGDGRYRLVQLQPPRDCG